MIKAALIILVLASAFPVGWLLAYLCRDELVSGRKWFKMIAVICAVLIVLLVLVRVSNWLGMSLGLAYLAIISLVSLKLSFSSKI